VAAVWPMPAVLRGSCPVIGSCGGRAHSPMGTGRADRLDPALTAMGVDHDLKVYPEAVHAFLTDHDPGDVNRSSACWLGSLDRATTSLRKDARKHISAFSSGTCPPPRMRAMAADVGPPAGRTTGLPEGDRAAGAPLLIGGALGWHLRPDRLSDGAWPDSALTTYVHRVGDTPREVPR